MSEVREIPEAAPPSEGGTASSGPWSGASEAEAWARVLAAWGDEAAHRAYLAGFKDLAGMTVAGGRYRAVLAERPDDRVAARMRDEIVKRATAYGLASLPRTSPAAASPSWKRLRMGASLLFGAAAVWAVVQLVRLLRARF
jgi:hypothetical protein